MNSNSYTIVISLLSLFNSFDCGQMRIQSNEIDKVIYTDVQGYGRIFGGSECSCFFKVYLNFFSKFCINFSPFSIRFHLLWFLLSFWWIMIFCLSFFMCSIYFAILFVQFFFVLLLFLNPSLVTRMPHSLTFLITNYNSRVTLYSFFNRKWEKLSCWKGNYE